MGVRLKEAFYDVSTIERGVLRWEYDRKRRSRMGLQLRGVLGWGYT